MTQLLDFQMTYILNLRPVNQFTNWIGKNSIKTWPRRQASLEENFLSAFGIISLVAASGAPLTKELKSPFSKKKKKASTLPVHLCLSVHEVFPWTLTHTAHSRLPPMPASPPQPPPSFYPFKIAEHFSNVFYFVLIYYIYLLYSLLVYEFNRKSLFCSWCLNAHNESTIIPYNSGPLINTFENVSQRLKMCPSEASLCWWKVLNGTPKGIT